MRKKVFLRLVRHMEAELDLRPFFRAVLRRWLLIMVIILGLTIIGWVVGYLTPPSHSASADVLVIPSSSQVTLDERFVTNDVSQLSNPTLQREALLALGTSNTLERLVLDTLPPEVRSTYSSNGSLAAAMSVTAQGDLLRFKAYSVSDEYAQVVVEAWAKSYEQLVDDLFNGDASLAEEVKVQLIAAQERYNEAQLQLEEFVATSTLSELEQRVQNLQALLTNAAAADQQLYSDYLERVRKLDLLIADAQTLRDQLANGNVDGLSNTLSLLSLRIRAVGVTDLPFDIQLQSEQLATQDPGRTIEEIDQVVAVLEARRVDIYETAQGIARSLASGDGELIGLAGQVRARYAKELSELVRQQEGQLSQRRLLEERRNIAFESLKLLQSKSDEQVIAGSSRQVEVRFINASIDPPIAPLRRLLTNSAIGFGIGLVLALIIVLIVDILRPALRKLSQPPSTEPKLRPTGGEHTAAD
jgi:capsular polysaccharide biosynthesis protein